MGSERGWTADFLLDLLHVGIIPTVDNIQSP